MNKLHLELIGLEVGQAEEVLSQRAVSFKFVYFRDRKQKNYDKEIVTAVKSVDGQLILTVCPMQFAVID